MTGAAKAPRQKKREIHYALDVRDGAVFLVQRPRNARLMAGMWELPEVASALDDTSQQQVPRSARNDNRNGSQKKKKMPFLKLRHSITVTDYTVHVWLGDTLENANGKWIAIRRLPKLAMTGLARKILRTAELLRDDKLERIGAGLKASQS